METRPGQCAQRDPTRKPHLRSIPRVRIALCRPTITGVLAAQLFLRRLVLGLADQIRQRHAQPPGQLLHGVDRRHVAAKLQQGDEAHRDIGAPRQRFLRQVLRQTAAAQDGGEGQGEGLDGAGRGFDRQGLCSGWFGKDVTPQML